MNVGMGVANPTATLEIASSTAPPTLRIGGTGSNANSGVQSIEFGSYDASGVYHPGASIRASTSQSAAAQSRRSLGSGSNSTTLLLSADTTQVASLSVSGAARVQSLEVCTFHFLGGGFLPPVCEY